ncbi:MAG: hypothetical protein R2702_07600 [Acidimicrobiales bacterium]
MADDPPTAPSSWQHDELAEVERAERGRRLPLLLGGAAGLLVIAAIAYVLMAKPFDVQRDLVWPADLGGRPAGLGEIDEIAAEVTPEVEPGAYLWNDFDGWHLWFAFGDGFDRATGTIRSDDDVSKLLLSPTSSGTASGDGGEVSFELDDSAPLVGIDFEPGFYAKRVEVRIEGPDGPLPDDMVHRGQAAKPAALPLVEEKDDAPNG